MLEGAIYFLLKKHFRKEPYYVDLLELFHDVCFYLFYYLHCNVFFLDLAAHLFFFLDVKVTFQTELGQLIDLLTAPEDHVDLSKFSLNKSVVSFPPVHTQREKGHLTKGDHFSFRHHLIVVYKTAFYSFYLPVALAMRMVRSITHSPFPLKTYRLFFLGV